MFKSRVWNQETRNSKLETRKLETRNSKLETRNSKLETRNSKLETRNSLLLVGASEFRISLFEFRLLLFQRLQHLALDLSVLLDAPSHAHRSRLKHQAAAAVVSIGEKHHFIHAALVFQRDEHHVAVIFCSDMPVSHDPAAQRHALPAQARKFIAPSFAVARQKIERVAAHAHLQDFALVPQLLFQRVLWARHSCLSVFFFRCEDDRQECLSYSHCYRRPCLRTFIRLQQVPAPQHLRPRHFVRVIVYFIA